MKKKIFLAVLCAAAVSLSCHKSHSVSSTASCKLTGVHVTGNGWSGSYVISYNSAGKLSTVQYSESTGTNYTRSFKYDGNAIVVTTAGSGASTDSVILSANGYVDRILIYNGVTRTAVDSFMYDGSQQLAKTVFTPDGGAATVATYQYSNGDIISSDWATAHSTYTYYTDKAASVGDLFVLGQWLQFGVVYEKCRHLSKSETIGSTTENITYTFDAEGRITGATQSSGGSTEATFSFTYDCN